MSYRPRRTRIYDANYDIGESYYKQQLKALNNRNGPTRSAEQYLPKNSNNQNEYESLNTSMPRVIFSDDEDECLKTKSKKILKKIFDENNLSTKPFENNTLSLKTRNVYTLDDSNDFENENTDDKTLRCISTKITNFALNDRKNQPNNITSGHRRLKLKTENECENVDILPSSAISSRMKVTKARLADLETEMVCIKEKQAEREKRNCNLKKFLNHVDSDYSLSNI